MAEFLPLILQMAVIFGIFYFIIIRPQNKKRDNFQKKLDNIKKGDKVITAGGLKGTIKDFQGKNNEIVILDVGSETKVNCIRTYIVNVEGK
jgi:preprotein translocase subunit YajC|tara:strand:+ start:1006 stop:1278 length:273 start_codon:yes stop_codon:yes gene_type:complete